MTNTVVRIEGDTYPFEINIRRESGPYDLTGATVALAIGRTIPDANAVSMNATTIENSAAIFVLTAPIYNLPTGDYFAQIQVTDINGYIWTPSQFNWKVKAVI